MNALVTAEQTSSGGSLLIFLLPLALLGWLMWTQRKRAKQAASLQSSIVVGDEICTTAGLYAHVVDLEGQVVTLDVGDGVTMRFDRRAIAMKVPSPPSTAPASDSPVAATD